MYTEKQIDEYNIDSEKLWLVSKQIVLPKYASYYFESYEEAEQFCAENGISPKYNIAPPVTKVD